MAAYPKFEQTVEPYQRVIPPTRHQNRFEARTYQFTLGQLIILLSVALGTMIAVFLFGMFAGKERGIELALRHSNLPGIRTAIPVIEQPSTPAAITSAPTATDQKPPSSRESLRDDTLQELTTTPTADRGGASIASRTAASAMAISEHATAQAGQGGTTAGTLAERLPKKKVVKSPVSALPIKDLPEAKTVVPPKQQPPAAKKATPTKSGSKLRVLKKVPSGYYVQVTAERNRSSSKTHASRLLAKGYPTIVEDTTVRGRRYYRVLLGPYKTRAAASKSQRKALKSRAIKGKPFIKRVK